MRHTLKKYSIRYDFKKVIIIIGESIVEIDTKKDGSWYLYKLFKDKELYFVSYENDVLTVSVNEMTGHDNQGLYCDIYKGAEKVARVFQDNYYETEEELEARAKKEVEELEARTKKEVVK